MVSKILTATLFGVNPLLIEVEMNISRGLPCFHIVGLPGKTINESKERVISAIKNSNVDFPVKRIIVNLAPANIKKEKVILDLPIAAAILSSIGVLKMQEKPFNYIFLGELSLDGMIKKVKGILPILTLCKKENINNAVIPYENYNEAKLIPGLKLIPVKIMPIADPTVAPQVKRIRICFLLMQGFRFFPVFRRIHLSLFPFSWSKTRASTAVAPLPSSITINGLISISATTSRSSWARRAVFMRTVESA